MYIADYGNLCIRKVSNGIIETVAGTCSYYDLYDDQFNSISYSDSNDAYMDDADLLRYRGEGTPISHTYSLKFSYSFTPITHR